MSKRTPSEEHKPNGRPSRYRAEFAEQAYRICSLGATDAELAEIFGVSEQTLNTWKQKHPKFLESIKRGKAPADAEVAEKLFHRAKGYSHTEDKLFYHEGEITVVETTKHYPPDTAAASLWLRNRQPERWRDKVSHEVGGPNGGPIPVANANLDFSEMSAAEAARVYKNFIDSVD